MRRAFGAVARGAFAGAIGMIVMDLVWYRRYKRAGGSRDFAAWEFATAVDEWENAPAPAQVGHLIAKKLTGRELEACGWTSFMNNVVHWATGMGWGAVYGALSLVRGPSLTEAVPFTTVVWAIPYFALVPSGIYKPIWEYDAKTIAKDYSAHMVYGETMALVYRVLAGSD